jgi:hypothetical protein
MMEGSEGYSPVSTRHPPFFSEVTGPVNDAFVGHSGGTGGIPAIVVVVDVVVLVDVEVVDVDVAVEVVVGKVVAVVVAVVATGPVVVVVVVVGEERVPARPPAGPIATGRTPMRLAARRGVASRIAYPPRRRLATGRSRSTHHAGRVGVPVASAERRRTRTATRSGGRFDTGRP